MKISQIIPIKDDFSLSGLFKFEKTPLNVLMAVVSIGLFLWMSYGIGNYLAHGHHAYNVTREHPWGILIATYVFFVVSSTGLCIISSFGHVFNVPGFAIIGKRAIMGAILTISTGFAVIAFEIGHPVTMVIYNVLSPGLTSAIWWMGTLYGMYLFFIILEFIFLARADHKWSKVFGIGGLVAGVAAHSNLGAVFGFLVARPIANGVFYPIYFILSAMITGIYLLFLMYGFRYKLKFPPEVQELLYKIGKLLALLLAILMFFETWRFITAIYGGMPERADTALHILTSPTFIYGEVLLGMVIPFVVAFTSKGRATVALVFSSVLGMIGIFFMRYDLVHDAQLFPMQTLKIREYQLEPTWVEYIPSHSELAISLGGIGLCLILYYIADKAFNLDHSKEDIH
jgi:molybdopterin-containing oxidoreductase family membrane subunit